MHIHDQTSTSMCSADAYTHMLNTLDPWDPVASSRKSLLSSWRAVSPHPHGGQIKIKHSALILWALICFCADHGAVETLNRQRLRTVFVVFIQQHLQIGSANTQGSLVPMAWQSWNENKPVSYSTINKHKIVSSSDWQLAIPGCSWSFQESIKHVIQVWCLSGTQLSLSNRQTFSWPAHLFVTLSRHYCRCTQKYLGFSPSLHPLLTTTRDLI